MFYSFLYRYLSWLTLFNFDVDGRIYSGSSVKSICLNSFLDEEMRIERVRIFYAFLYRYLSWLMWCSFNVDGRICNDH